MTLSGFVFDLLYKIDDPSQARVPLKHKDFSTELFGTTYSVIISFA